jgi:hypothetical protein
VYVVPAGVCQVTVIATGAAGGRGNDSGGGGGGRASDVRRSPDGLGDRLVVAGGSSFGPAAATFASGVGTANGQVLINYDPAVQNCLPAAITVAPRFTG